MHDFILSVILLIVMGFLFFLFYRNSKKGKVYNKLPGRELFFKPENYKRYILLSNIPSDFIKQELVRYSNLVNSGIKEFRFIVKELNRKVLIECDEDLPQIHYYNLVSHFSVNTNCIGYSESLSENFESFIFKFDESNPEGDTLIGLLKNGKNFFVSISDISAEVTKNVNPGFGSVSEAKKVFLFDEIVKTDVTEVIRIEL